LIKNVCWLRKEFLFHSYSIRILSYASFGDVSVIFVTGIRRVNFGFIYVGVKQRLSCHLLAIGVP